MAESEWSRVHGQKADFGTTSTKIKDWYRSCKVEGMYQTPRKYEGSLWKGRYSFNLYSIPCKNKTSIVEKGICQGDNPKNDNADRDVIYTDSYQKYEIKPHQSNYEKKFRCRCEICLEGWKKKCDDYLGLERNRNLHNTTSSIREPSDILYTFEYIKYLMVTFWITITLWLCFPR